MTSGEAVSGSEDLAQDSAIDVVDVEKWMGTSVTEQWGQWGRGPQGGLYGFLDCEYKRNQGDSVAVVS